MHIATKADADEIRTMCFAFVENSPYAQLVDSKKIEGLIETFLSSDSTDKVILLEPGKGFIAGVVSDFTFGTIKVGSELAWWVNLEERGSEVGSKLLEAFEVWAKTMGCSVVTMVDLNGSLEEVYKKRKYRLYEQAYLKAI